MDVGTEMYLQFLQGDESMLEKLVATYSDGLVAFAYCIVSDSAVAEDVVEDAFATLIVRRRHFSPKAKFKTYLYKIVRNKCLDYLRFHKKFVPFSTTACTLLRTAKLSRFCSVLSSDFFVVPNVQEEFAPEVFAFFQKVFFK